MKNPQKWQNTSIINGLRQKLLTRSRIMDEDSHEPVGDDLRMVFIQIPAFNKTEDECATPFDEWMFNLIHMDSMERMRFTSHQDIISEIQNIAEKVIDSGEGVDRETALALMRTRELDALCDAADRICKAFHGRRFDSCSIVNARSGMCGEDCKWCAQTRHHDTGCATYNFLDEEQTMKAARLNEETGIQRFSLVTSGRAVSDRDLDKFIKIIERLKAETGLRLCVSMGLLTEPQLKRLKEAGIERYHCNMETSEKMWPKLVTTHSQADKRKTIEAARRQGMAICSGGIIGMGESEEDRVDFAIMLRDMGVDSVPMNILNPIKGTPLEGTPLIGEEEIIRCAAVWRFILPRQVIRFAGGRGRLSKKNMERIFTGGVNGAIMGDMLTTIGNTIREDKEMLAALDFEF